MIVIINHSCCLGQPFVRGCPFGKISQPSSISFWMCRASFLLVMATTPEGQTFSGKCQVFQICWLHKVEIWPESPWFHYFNGTLTDVPVRVCIMWTCAFIRMLFDLKKYIWFTYSTKANLSWPVSLERQALCHSKKWKTMLLCSEPEHPAAAGVTVSVN